MNSDTTTNSTMAYISMPFNNINDIIMNESFLNIIDEIFNNNSNNEYIVNDNDNIEYHIYYDVMDDEETRNNSYNEEEYDYFSSCKEINNKLCKPIRIKENDNLIINKEYCNICCEDYIIGQYKRTLPSCNHIFHKKCVDKWLKTKSNCPVCRNELKK